MSDWRSMFGFGADEDLSFGAVHDRYRQKILTLEAALEPMTCGG